MTQISLSKAYAIIDARRGKLLAARMAWPECDDRYKNASAKLRILNELKKEFALVSDAEQIPLGL